MFQTKVVEKIKTHILCSVTLKYRADFELMWKNINLIVAPSIFAESLQFIIPN